ncbi:MAG: DEAD/DEAH box helicase family protein [Planctomycetota bacterium]|nr:DEAD/DEAH box helicase family protein [Planctomycetota bacterium]
MSKLNEADTCRVYVTPALLAAGWDKPAWRVAEQHYFTDGQIVLVGDGHRRQKGKKADYLLRYQESFPIAVVEAKDEDHEPAAGLQQAKDYAQILGLHFAYSTNGHGIEEWDFTTNTQCSLTTYPSPSDLWQRLCAYKTLDAARVRNPLLTPYCTKGGKAPRYYQEVAINNTIEAILQGRERILINLATGTGKTVIAFQLAWKLWHSRWNISGADRPPRILFLADRNVLRDQAYNTFEPFENERDVISEGQAPVNRSIYFGIYQAMFTGVDGARLYQKYPSDFFDLIIIDECHRSGFGTWNAILKHFETAVQLGMTATPKRTENIDSYRYFGDAVFTYSLGQGIDDGFLATYKVHRSRTNFTRDGLVIQDATSQGAQVEVPEGEQVEDRYDMPEFERRITMPDHVRKLCEHMSKLLNRFGRMEKTMVFCVNMDHALQVTQELNRLNADLNVPDYAVRIVSEEGATGKALLEKFQDTEKQIPVIATTVDLLTTGVDAPSVRNVVFMKPVSSIVSFKQIVGRGSRLCADTDKFWFRVIDYTNATRLFDDWDRPSEPGEGGAETGEPFTCVVGGTVTDEETGEPIANARVFLQTGPNEVVDQFTGPNGQFFFPNIGKGTVVIVITAKDHKRAQMTVQTDPAAALALAVALKPTKDVVHRRVKITGLDVKMVDEVYEERDADGNLVTPEDYLRKVREEILAACRSMVELQKAWVDKPRREALLDTLEGRMVHLDILREILQRPDADSYDLLAHVAFGANLHSCEERANALFNLHKEFFENFDQEARDVLLALVDKYRFGGLLEVADPSVFTLAPFNSDVRHIAKSFGGIPELRRAIDELIRRLYMPEAA